MQPLRAHAPRSPRVLIRCRDWPSSARHATTRTSLSRASASSALRACGQGLSFSFGPHQRHRPGRIAATAARHRLDRYDPRPTTPSRSIRSATAWGASWSRHGSSRPARNGPVPGRDADARRGHDQAPSAWSATSSCVDPGRMAHRRGRAPGTSRRRRRRSPTLTQAISPQGAAGSREEVALPSLNSPAMDQRPHLAARSPQGTPGGRHAPRAAASGRTAPAPLSRDASQGCQVATA
jgi:hypothetical protein